MLGAVACLFHCMCVSGVISVSTDKSAFVSVVCGSKDHSSCLFASLIIIVVVRLYLSLYALSLLDVN